MENLSNVAQILLGDTKFVKTLEGQIKYIMSDGKIDTSDIPEIMEIITESYNNLGKVKVTYDQLPELFNEIIEYIIEKFNIIPDDQEDDFRKMVAMAIKLIMIKPNVKKSCMKCLKIFSCK
jgi:hypothetical protein